MFAILSNIKITFFTDNLGAKVLINIYSLNIIRSLSAMWLVISK